MSGPVGQGKNGGATAFTSRVIDGVDPTRVFGQLVPPDLNLAGAPITEIPEVVFTRTADRARRANLVGNVQRSDHRGHAHAGRLRILCRRHGGETHRPGIQCAGGVDSPSPPERLGGGVGLDERGVKRRPGAPIRRLTLQGGFKVTARKRRPWHAMCCG